jgi:DNA-binding NarL/FixJ family response regulator
LIFNFADVKNIIPMSLPELKNVIVVDDSASDRTMMQDFLSRYKDVTINGYFSGEACIKDIVNQRVENPDLIVMDYFLDSTVAAKYDGLETLVKIKELCPDSKVIMFTSVENQRIAELAKEKGAYNYAVKGPEGFDRLDKLIRNAFEV